MVETPTDEQPGNVEEHSGNAGERSGNAEERSGKPGWPRARAWLEPYLPALLLLALLVTVVAINARYLELFPFPPSSQHQASTLVPRHMHHFLGYTAHEEARNLQVSEHGYVLPERRPLPWTRPLELLGELRAGGRLHPLIGECPGYYWTCMPHSFALLGAIAALAPGHPTLVGLGITAYFLLLLVAAYGIGSCIRDRWTGLAAAAIAAGYPALFGYSRWIEGYLPVTALTVAMVWALLRSRGLSRPWPVIAFCLLAFSAIRSGEGLSEAIGAGLAVSGPFLAELWWGMRHGPSEGSSRLRTLAGLLFVLIFLGITTDLSWVINGLRQILGGLTDYDVAARLSSEGEAAPSSPLISYGLYLILIYTQYLKPVMAGWWLLALPIFLVGPVRRKGSILLWFLIPLAAFSYMTRKAQWYALPIVPPLAVMTAAGLSSLRPRWVRATALTLAMATALFQLVVFASPTLTHRLGVPSWIRRPYGMREINVRQAELLAPGDLPMIFLHRDTDRFLEYLEKAVPPSDRLKYIAVVTDWPKNPYEGQVFAHLVELTRPDFEVINLTEAPLNRPDAFAGLKAEDFAFFVRLRLEQFIPCCDAEGNVQLNAPGNLAPPPPPLWELASALIARSKGMVPGLPTVYALEHPEVPDVTGESGGR